MSMKKILIIRFSSFGDIVQAMGALPFIQSKWPHAKIHWATRDDFSDLVKLSPRVDHVWTLPSSAKGGDFKSLLELTRKLHQENFDLIYDAHSNLRSKLMKLILSQWGSKATMITRSKERLKRLLLFTFRINLFPKPYRGILSYLAPLGGGIGDFTHEKWTFPKSLSQSSADTTTTRIVIVPSAAWEMKRWPCDYFIKFILGLPKELPSRTFAYSILGGSSDHFCEDIAKACANSALNITVENLAGKLSLMESIHRLACGADFVLSADTGFLHVADLLGIKGIALMGPTAFGFPSGHTLKILESPSYLPCRPCTKDGRGKCSQKTYKRCLTEITPEMAIKATVQMLQ
ncbi:MAG: glycosyltransferase family 9 protein [Oligoflexia bacterium]|nr:glycosyltransferase family 9 protein [Oligoflexia bacterium]MBF0364192.1 glycosyltransferase family 9 protein [Oligoflexia bacterium]